MYEPADRSATPWYKWLNNGGVIKILEFIQDFIIISLCVGLFGFMSLQLREMFVSLLPPLNFTRVTADILFVLILVELFRLLIIYLQERRVSIGVAVEVSIVSVLREIIVKGILEIPWSQVLATCSFLLVLAVLLVVRVWLPPTFEGVDPEQKVSEKYKQKIVNKNSSIDNQPLTTNN
ncbi:phosphate-starvation-inducible PsiE family protein [Pleurocapsales cyanobacterium LEGE 10410]|nr:phosphate-starvation-inducible PsiE family protein [Pleurocapsales cyanobacterium LEGE 10410]